MERTSATSKPPGTRASQGLRGRSGRGFVAGTLLIVLVVGAWWLNRSPESPEEPTMLASELARVDGRLMAPGSTPRPFKGWITEFYPDGSPKSRSHVSDGLLQGVSEGWHPNGSLQVREHFVAGVAQGPVAKWYPNGVMLSEGVARHGRLDGVFRRWHDAGQIAEEILLEDGQPHGFSRAWFPSGHLKAEALLEDGKVVRQRFWQDGEHPELVPVSTSKTSR